MDLTATNTSQLTGIGRSTLNKYFDRFHRVILLSSANNEKEDEVFELNGSYFGGKRGRGSADKTPVFGLLKRNGRVYVCMVQIAQKNN